MVVHKQLRPFFYPVVLSSRVNYGVTVPKHAIGVIELTGVFAIIYVEHAIGSRPVIDFDTSRVTEFTCFRDTDIHLYFLVWRSLKPVDKEL